MIKEMIKQKQRNFQMVKCHLKIKVSDIIWFAKKDLQFPAITICSDYLKKSIEPTVCTSHVK